LCCKRHLSCEFLIWINRLTVPLNCDNLWKQSGMLCPVDTSPKGRIIPATQSYFLRDANFRDGSKRCRFTDSELQNKLNLWNESKLDAIHEAKLEGICETKWNFTFEETKQNYFFFVKQANFHVTTFLFRFASCFAKQRKEAKLDTLTISHIISNLQSLGPCENNFSRVFALPKPFLRGSLSRIPIWSFRVFIFSKLINRPAWNLVKKLCFMYQVLGTRTKTKSWKFKGIVTRDFEVFFCILSCCPSGECSFAF
jgi:hypothetical protein